MHHWQVFEDCRAAVHYGGAWFARSEVKLVDCHFLRCHAEAKYCGGCSSANGADVEMIRGSIMGCSAGGSGGVNMYGMSTLSLLNVTITECRATTPDKGSAGGIGVYDASVLTMSGGTIRDCEAPDRGGGLVIDSTSQAHLHGVAIAECRAATPDKGEGGGIFVGDDSVLTMSGGAIRDCEATDRGGGLWVFGGTAQAHLHGVAVQRCKASIKAGGMDLGGNVSLVDVSIEDCYANERAAMQVVGSLRAERVRVARARGNLPTYLFGTSTWTDSTFVDCSAGPDIMLGAHSFTRLNVRGASHYIGVTVNIGVAVVIDSHIADGHGTCVAAAHNGALILRNVTLSNCSAPVWLQSAKAAAAFQAELLTLEPACEAERSGALIRVDDAAFTAPLNVRGLRVVEPACASADLTIFSDHVRPQNCSKNVCGGAATCTEVQPLPSAAPNLTTVDCACTGDPNPSGTSGALAPYGFDPSSLGLPDGIDVSDIGLPGSIIDYCVCCSTR